MYDLIRISNATSTAHIDVNDDIYYPVEEFTWTPNMIGESQAVLSGPGKHPNYQDVESMSITMNGHIKADTTELYWAARDALLNIVIPDPKQTIPIHGTVQFKRNGDSDTYFQRVHITHWEVPTEALYPTVTPFRFEWDGLDGYWIKLSNFSYAKI